MNGGRRCAPEGSEPDLTDLFVDGARNERVLLVEPHTTGEDEAEVTASGGPLGIQGAGCDEERAPGGKP